MLVVVQSHLLERLNVPSLSALIRDSDVPNQYSLVIFISLVMLRNLQRTSNPQDKLARNINLLPTAALKYSPFQKGELSGMGKKNVFLPG